MKSIPLRVRITLLVLATSALTIAVIVLFGAVSSIDEDVAVESFESTSEAMVQTDERLHTYSERLQARIRGWFEDEGGQPFQDWNEEDGIGNLQVLDVGGREIELISDGQVQIVGTVRCRATADFLNCQEEDDGSGPVRWAINEVERRAETVSLDVPVVVHGIVIRDSAGDNLLVRFEADVFAADEEISSGIEDLALIVLPLLLVIIGAITWFSLGRALSPVQGMIDQVDEIGVDSLDHRVPVPEADDELKHLATTMNQMLDRLQGANERQRQFISDASHELRSPITATGATLEVARSNPDEADWEHVAAVVDEENTRLASLVDDLLLLARMDESAGSNPSSGDWQVDLEEICLAEADRPHPVDVNVKVIEPVRVAGNVSTLTRAIRNLVDNAAAHAATGVRIEVGHRGPEAIVRVHDDGPGVPPEYADKIFERFVRADESRVRNGTGGAGLGLAIARRVAHNHGGRLDLVPAIEGSGATFELGLPRATL